MSGTRRMKEPSVPTGSPFESVVEAGRAMVLGLTRALPADPDAKNMILAKVEGMEAILLLCQRAAASEKIDVPRMVKIERAPVSLEERVRRLEARVFGGGQQGYSISDSPVTRPGKPIRTVPEILRAPEKSRDPQVGGYGRCERALLTVLVKRNKSATTAAQLSVLSGYSFKSSGFQNSLSHLRSSGCAEGGALNVRATDEGFRVARDLGLDVTPMPTGRALVEYWVGNLPRAEGIILQALCIAHPATLDKDQLSAATNYSRTSSGFQNAVSKLRSLRLATKGWPMTAAPVFFEGATR